jgi:hypothetical protein
VLSYLLDCGKSKADNFIVCGFPFFMQHVGQVETRRTHQSKKETHLAASNKETM